MEKLIKNLANCLILAGGLIIIYIYFPLIKIYLFPASIQTTFTPDDYIITIPKINAQANVIQNVNPWNETDYKLALQKGVAQARGFASPGQNGTIFMFAHSSDNPWNITRSNAIFLRLPELTLGDTITINKNGQSYTYRVFDKKEVWPNHVGSLQSTSTNQLILQTCVPIGTSLKRLLIFASPTKIPPSR